MTKKNYKKISLAWLLTHPIQYQSPLLSRISSEPDIDLVVFYQSDCSIGRYNDVGFRCSVLWDTPLMEGYSYRFLPSLGNRNTLSYLRPLNFGLAPLLKKGKFDAIVVHGYNRPYHWAAILRSKLIGIRVFIRDEPTLFSKKRGPLNKQLKRLFFFTLNKFVEGFLAIGTANALYYLSNGIPKNRIFLTPYSVDNAFFIKRSKETKKHQPDLRKYLNLEPGRPVILYTGKLQRRKRPIDLLEAFLKAKNSINPPPYLLYIGEGELKHDLLNRIRSLHDDSVKFLGFRNQTELPAFYNLCDIFVIPSFHEPWGLVVNEAMCAGKAVIVSDHVGSGVDLVKNAENGYIYPAGDIDALSDCLIKALSDPIKCKDMGKRSADIIKHWSFAEDLRGLRRALRLPVQQQIRKDI